MVIVGLLVVIAAFVVVGVVGWAAWLIISTALTGLFIGALGRLLVPGRQPIGVMATIVCGLAGSFIGTLIGRGFGIDHLLTVLIEIGAATVVVGFWSIAASRRTPVMSTGHHRVIDI